MINKFVAGEFVDNFHEILEITRNSWNLATPYYDCSTSARQNLIKSRTVGDTRRVFRRDGESDL